MDPNKNNDSHPQWLRTALREVRIRRGVILFGNVRDEFYDPPERQHVTLAERLVRELTRDPSYGFTIVTRWDRADGVSFSDSRAAQRFQEAVSRAGAQPAQPGGTAYDMGAGRTGTSAPAPASGLYAQPRELMAAARAVFESDRERLALILDWTHLIMDQPGALGDENRLWMLDFAKALVGGPVIPADSDRLRQNRGVVIFLTAHLGQLPPLLYQGDPRVRLISVPSPSRPERRDFFAKHFDDVRCKTSETRRSDGSSVAQSREQLAEHFSDLTDQLTAVDLRQLLSLSLCTEEPLPPDRLLNLYRFGDQRSPWEELNREKLSQAEQLLKRRVIGQDEAVEKVATMIIRAKLGLAGLFHSRKQCKPKGTLFFVGPTGVGKTELAKAFAELVFGDESACIRFDMSEYSAEHSDQRLIGAPPGYVGFEEGGQLTNKVRERPFCVLLFDEIEKAHPKILDKFIQILEDGRLTDGHGETVYFSESVIIFTSNIGARDVPVGADWDAMNLHFRNAVERHFKVELGRPETFSRLGRNIVVFNPIIDDGFRQAILDKQVAPLREMLEERHGIRFGLAPEVSAHILRSARTDQGGRDVGNALESELMNPLARFLFDHEHQLRKGRLLQAGVQNERIVFDIREV